MKISREHARALAEISFVTFLWSISKILIKIGLGEISPLAFATYRYTIASSILALVVVCRYGIDAATINRRQVLVFLLLGFTGYFVAPALQFLGLYYLDAVTVTFVLDLTRFLVLILSVLFLKEIPSFIQLVGIALALAGVLAFFHGSIVVSEGITGLFAAFFSGVGLAAFTVLSRHYLRGYRGNVVSLTVCSMALGSMMLLGATVLTQNVMAISLNGWIIVLWLGVVNTALAYVLWNHALKVLKAYEHSIVQNTMLVQTALLAYVFLNESLTPYKILGIVLVFVGVLVVQLRPLMSGPSPPGIP
jgi:drug/metabolite transporter (DMT)-like permease